MGQQGDHLGTGEARSAEEILQIVTQDLKSLQQGLVAQLSQEVTQLQSEKVRLQSEVEQLHAEYRSLHSARSLPQQQWARQLAQGLAIQLQTLMVQRLQQSVGSSDSPGLDANARREAADRLLASLDSSFGSTFRILQQNLSDPQSALSQQLDRSQTQERQAEVILEALVNCLREQIHSESTQSLIAPPDANPIPFEVPAGPLPVAKPPQKELNQIQLGFLLVLLSTAALSFHNVVVRVIGRSSSIFGLPPIGGFIQLGPGNSLLILWLRMLVVLPLMIPVSMWLYPSVWRDLKRFLTLSDRRPIYTVVGSGIFLFLSQILIYIAIGKIGPSVAVAILFLYPLVTVPVAWALFRDKPTLLRWGVMGVISLGVILTALPSLKERSIASPEGVAAAVAAGVSFAGYLIFMQLGFKAKLHPIPVSLVQFFTIFVLSSMLLILPLNDLEVKVAQPIGFVVGGIVLGVLTLVGYLANNFGVRYMGAARASIVASSGPVVTALLAFLIIQTELNFWQIVGILLVTGGVTALSFERMKTK